MPHSDYRRPKAHVSALGSKTSSPLGRDLASTHCFCNVPAAPTAHLGISTLSFILWPRTWTVSKFITKMYISRRRILSMHFFRVWVLGKKKKKTTSHSFFLSPDPRDSYYCMKIRTLVGSWPYRISQTQPSESFKGHFGNDSFTREYSCWRAHDNSFLRRRRKWLESSFPMWSHGLKTYLTWENIIDAITPAIFLPKLIRKPTQTLNPPPNPPLAFYDIHQDFCFSLSGMTRRAEDFKEIYSVFWI